MNAIEAAQFQGIDVLHFTLAGFQSVTRHDVFFFKLLCQPNSPSKKKAALADSLYKFHTCFIFDAIPASF